MKKMLGAAAMLAGFTVPVSAQVHYDLQLEKAAMAIVAGKMGDIRGGFSYAQKPKLVAGRNTAQPASDSRLQQSSDNSVQALPSQSGPPSSITGF